MEGIIPLVNLGSGCDYHRIVLPYKHLGVDFDKFLNVPFDKVVKDTKVLVFNRLLRPDPVQYFKLRDKYGFKIICDLDDYWELSPNHILNPNWIKNRVAEKIQFCAKHADVVTVTTKLLADKIKHINKNIHVISNALPFGEDQFNDEKVESDKFRIMYAGGSTHFWDLKLLNVPFTKANNNPKFDNTEFVLAGFCPDEKGNDEVWRKIERAYNLNDKLKNYIRRDSLPLTEYMDHYKYADLCVIPLEDNHFNKFKSSLKILESGCKYTPCIASDVSPYADESNRDVVMYAKNAATWYDHLKYCVENPNFVKDKGQQLGEYVRENYNLLKVNKLREQLIESLI